jgi:hypothetical protein
MFGCLRRVGCLALLVIVAGAAYITRHRWVPLVLPGRGTDVTSLEWKPISSGAGARARRAMVRLDQPTGPVFANLSADEFASFILDSVARGLAESARSVEAAVQRDRLLLRTTLRIGDLGVENVPFLGGVADKTATVLIGGTLSVERPGFGEWRVKTIRVDAIEVPGPMLGRVTRELARRMRRAATRDDAFGFALPAQVADLRIDQGKITLYKAAK